MQWLADRLSFRVFCVWFCPLFPIVWNTVAARQPKARAWQFRSNIVTWRETCCPREQNSRAECIDAFLSYVVALPLQPLQTVVFRHCDVFLTSLFISIGIHHMLLTLTQFVLQVCVFALLLCVNPLAICLHAPSGHVIMSYHTPLFMRAACFLGCLPIIGCRPPTRAQYAR